MGLQYKKWVFIKIAILAAFFLPSSKCLLFSQELIDVVYTWVDGSDEKWQEIRNRYYREYHPFINDTDANTKNRYRNRDELKYSLRSLYQFAPFINHIFIVTFGQCPRWLQEDPRITIVDHQEIFPNKADLPTFNSQAIEANLHRIPNLSEKFIYFNDDVFLGTHVEVEDFFTEEGLIYVNPSDYKVPRGAVEPDEVAYDAAWRNTDALLNAYFKKEKRFKLAHAPFPLTKSLVSEVEAKLPFVFQLVSSHKFRMPTDYTLTNGLIQYYALYTRKGKLTRIQSPMIRIRANLEKNAKRLEKVKNGSYKFFCLQDIIVEDCEEADNQLHEFLETYYPKIAPWEEGYVPDANSAQYPVREAIDMAEENDLQTI